jgi:uncharacterized protein YaiL (DUF2058 family)
MANSLQDQLLKAGLVSKNKLNDSRQQVKRKRKRSGGKATVDVQTNAAQKRRVEHQQRDKRLNAERDKQRQDQEQRLQIRELVLANSLNVVEADQLFNVVRDGRIRRVYVTAEQRSQLSNGTLAVTIAKGRNHIVSLQVAEKIRSLLPGYFVSLSSESDPPKATNEADDEYADFKVPDDLMW